VVCFFLREENEMKVLLNKTEAGELLGVSKPTFRLWSEDKNFPSPIKIGTSVRWVKEDIEKWLKEKTND
jgi:excisionase family DNA binding protein